MSLRETFYSFIGIAVPKEHQPRAQQLLESVVFKDELTPVKAAASSVSLHDIKDNSKHSSSATLDYMLKADSNGLPVNATNTDAQVSAAVTASHARQHVITSTSDHTSTATSGKMLKADASGLPVDATNTDVEVSAAVSASHSAVTLSAEADTLLGLSTQQITLDTKAANIVLAGPASGAATYPTFRSLVFADLPFLPKRVETATYTVAAGDEVIVCNKGTAMTVDLPAATATGRLLHIKNIGAGTVTVDCNGADTIEGSGTEDIYQWEAVQIVDYASGTWAVV